MLALEAAGVRFGDTWALAPTDLIVERGRTLALIGPSGSGKSTLLRLLVGLVSPTTGAVTFNGEPLPRSSDAAGRRRLAALRRRSGFVVQGGGLFPHLTAFDNAALMARQERWTAARIQTRINELADLLHLSHAELGRHPRQLSGGQRQRVALMRALVLDPEVLLLDEPLGALDPLIRVELQDELAALFHTLARTVVVVTHDLAEAAHLGDQLVLLANGKIEQTGALIDLVERPASTFVERFVGAWRVPSELSSKRGRAI